LSRRVLVTVALIALLAAAVAIRLVFASRAVPFGDDYGTAALMSKHISEGRDFPLYFYGYRYIGALGAYVGAFMFLLFGPSLFSMCLAMLPFTVLWVLATYWLFGRLVNPGAGLVGAALVAIAPPVIVEFSTAPLIGYPPTFAFGTLLLYFGVRLNSADLTSRAEWLCLLGIGALAALALWTNPLCLPYLVVTFGLLVMHVVRRRFNRALLVKLGAAFALWVVCLLPVIATAAAYGVRELFGNWPIGLRFIPQTAPAVAEYYLPNQLGSAVMPAFLNGLVGALYALLGILFFVGLVAAVRKRDAHALRGALVPLAFMLIFLVVFLSKPRGAEYAPRHFSPFYLAVIAWACVPMGARRRRVAAAAALAAVALVVYNAAATLAMAYGPEERRAGKWNAATEDLVEAARTAKLKHVMIHNYYGQALTFVAREEVLFVRTSKERYYPYTVSAAADDNAGFATRDAGAPVFAHTLEALGVSSWDSFSAGGWTVFYHIALPQERLDLVELVAAAFVLPDGTSLDAAGLIDRDDETVAGTRFDLHAALVVDFGRPVEVAAARFAAPDASDLPVGYTLSTSLDGTTWRTIQHVEQRNASTWICGNRLDQEGLSTPMECRFPAARLRYLRLSDARPAAPYFEVWRFSEAFFYALAPASGDAADAGRPSEAEAKTIARELERRAIAFVVADEWLSRKIERLDEPHPRVWPRWEFRFPRTHLPRTVPIAPGTAVVVETAHADAAARRLETDTLGDVTFGRIPFAHYTALVVEEAPADYATFPGLNWNGFTLLATARIAAADWYCRRGRRLDGAGRAEDAGRYYRRSFSTFPGIRANLERLAGSDEAARAALASLTPKHAALVHYPYGPSLVGYTLTPSPLVPGRPATLQLVWKLEGPIRHNYLQVFVHFRDASRRVFQADHNAVFPVEAGAVVPSALVLDEHEFLVPPDAPAGELTIYLGVTSAGDRVVRLKPHTKCRIWHRAVEIGTVQIAGHGASHD
jgi:hypothetical protein